MSDFSHYQQPALSQQPIGLCCNGFGWRSPSSACGPRTLPHFAAVLIEVGSGYFETVPSGLLEVRAPALFWLFPGVTHQYRPNPEGWSERWTMFEGIQAETALKLEYLSKQHPLHQLEEPLLTEVISVFDGLQRDFTRATHFAPLLGGAWVHRLIVACHAARLEQPSPPDSAQDKVQRALQALEQIAFASLDLANFAQLHGFSPAHFRRKVRELTGCSPQEYLTRLRLVRAKKLLVQTSISILEVAHQCGFEDPFYFSRVFQKLERLSPRAFRIQQQR